MDNFKRSSLNCFTVTTLDRMEAMRRDERWIADQLKKQDARFVPVWREMNLFSIKDSYRPVSPKSAVLGELKINIDSYIFLGKVNGNVHFAINLPPHDSTVPDKFSSFGHFQDLKKMAPLLDNGNIELLSYSKALTYWHRCHRFCGKCGNPTASIEGGHILVCTNKKCGHQHFPRTDPAIIVLITCGEKCLLGRQANWSKGWYSTIAGFVEPGESLEGAVTREVLEETGLRLKNVSYHSSQPWPFPCSIMLGFNAEATNSDIQIDGYELEDARWFSHREIYNGLNERSLYLPPKISISYLLIEDWYDTGTYGKLTNIIHSDNKW